MRKAEKTLLLCADHWMLYLYNHLWTISFLCTWKKMCRCVSVTRLCEVTTFPELINHVKNTTIFTLEIFEAFSGNRRTTNESHIQFFFLLVMNLPKMFTVCQTCICFA